MCRNERRLITGGHSQTSYIVSCLTLRGGGGSLHYLQTSEPWPFSVNNVVTHIGMFMSKLSWPFRKYTHYSCTQWGRVNGVCVCD